MLVTPIEIPVRRPQVMPGALARRNGNGFKELEVQAHGREINLQE
jgi:hypothetical protein